MKSRKTIKYIGDNKKFKDKEIGFFDFYGDNNSVGLYLTYSESEVKIAFNRRFCSDIMAKFSSFCNYTSISLFPTEKDKEVDILREISPIEIKDKGYQKFLYFNLTNDVSDYFINNYIDSSGKIMWFSFDYYISNKVSSSVLSIDHCGDECHIKFEKDFGLNELENLIENCECELVEVK